MDDWKVTATGTVTMSPEMRARLQQAIDASPPCDLCGKKPRACTATDTATGQVQNWCADCAQAWCQAHGFNYEDLV